MTQNLPKARRAVGTEQKVIYALIGVVAALILVVAGLLLGGDLFSDQPRTAAERDYQLLLQGVERYPDDPSVLMTLAEVEYDLGKTGDALEHASLAYEVGSDIAGIPMRYAQILVQEGEVEQARIAVEQELELDTLGNNPEPLFLLAQIQADLGDLETALETMADGLELGYMAADMRVVYGEMLADAGRTDEAISEFEEALRYLPGDERAVAGLAELGVEWEETETENPHEDASDDGSGDGSGDGDATDDTAGTE